MTEPKSFPNRAEAVLPSDMAERLQALQASRTTRGQTSTTREGQVNKPRRSSGPAPSRILAAAASVSAGIGLVALMAGAQPDIVVQVNPTPVTLQPANVIVALQPGSPGEDVPGIQARVVEAAAPAERPVPQARVVAQSEGS
jgi:hypothetical protein